MKFLHMADVHLGAVPDRGCPWAQKRAEELWQTFRRALYAARQEQVDLLLIAGDLFHRRPLLRELREVNYLFEQLGRTQVVLIAGNHDYLDEDSPYRTFEWAENVIFLDGETCECVRFKALQTTVYGFSYYQREIEEARYDDLLPEEEPGCHILLAHGGDAHHIPINWKRLAANGFDYVALGHIHKPHGPVVGRVVYAGALEPIDSNDTGKHGYVLGEYADGSLRTEFVPFACRDYIHLTLESTPAMTDYAMQEKLAQAIAQNGRQHLYKVELTGCRNPQTVYRTEQYGALGQIVEVTDHTEEDYDFASLYRRHRHDVIGRYIGSLLPQGVGAEISPVTRQALYYGIRAFHLQDG